MSNRVASRLSTTEVSLCSFTQEQPDYIYVLRLADANHARINDRVLYSSFILMPDKLVEDWSGGQAGAVASNRFGTRAGVGTDASHSIHWKSSHLSSSRSAGNLPDAWNRHQKS